MWYGGLDEEEEEEQVSPLPPPKVVKKIKIIPTNLEHSARSSKSTTATSSDKNQISTQRQTKIHNFSGQEILPIRKKEFVLSPTNGLLRDPRSASKVVRHWSLEDEYEMTGVIN